MINTALSIELIERTAEMLNNEIRKNGEIRINNKTIWDNFLHKMENEYWEGMLTALKELSEQRPYMFKSYHIDSIDLGLAALKKYSDYYDKVLDMKNRHLDHKKIAWRCLMTVREIYNECCDIHLPNTDDSKVKTTFGDLFQ